MGRTVNIMMGVLFLAIGIIAGAIVWYGFLPPGRYPVFIAFVPAVPFWIVGIFFFNRAKLQVFEIPGWTKWIIVPVFFVLFLFFFSWIADHL